MPDTTRSDIAEAVSDLESAVLSWEKLPADTNWRGVKIRPVNQQIDEAATTLMELCDSVDVDDDAREIVLAVDVFAERYREWSQRFVIGDSNVSPQGPPELWESYRAVLAKAQAPVRRLPEPIDQLMAQKVNSQIIAKIYGWYRTDGTPDIQKVDEESRKPGTHYDPKTWMSRQEVLRLAGINTLWEKRVENYEKKRAKASQIAREAHESLDDLISQRVNPEQIAKMKRIPVEDVRRRAAQMGFGLDAQTVAYANQNERHRALENEEQEGRDEQIALSRINTHPELPTLEQRVLACAADGHSHTTIARMLEKDFVGINYQKVGRVIRDNESVAAVK